MVPVNEDEPWQKECPMSRKSPSTVLSTLAQIAAALKPMQDGLRDAGFDPDERLLSLPDDPIRLKEVIRALAGQVAVPGAETVTVPDLPASALLAVVNEAIGLTYLNPDYAKYAFLRDERGKTYEVLTWAPGHGVSLDAVREHFSALGFCGNTAAFLEWNRKDHGDDWFVSIPEDDRCFRDAARNLYAPYFSRDGASRRLDLCRFAGDWYGDCVFVAFRECLK
jgi:hypothetical protein